MKLRKTKEKAVKSTFFTVAAISTSIIFFIFLFLFLKSVPALRQVGAGMLSAEWNAAAGNFGLLPAILGTLLVTVIALVVAVPVGIGSALFISELAPSRARQFLKPSVEILAGIPSIVYGFIGVVIFIPWVRETFGLLSGYTFFTGGVILGVMALPIVISMSDDAFQSVPGSMKEASLALGATKWQTLRDVTFPSAISGVTAAVIMGAGRAIGETMAVMLVVGSIMKIPEPFFDVFESGSTLTSLIANNMGEAYGLQVNVLFTAGVVLFIALIALSVVSDMIHKRVKKKFEGGAE